MYTFIFIKAKNMIFEKKNKNLIRLKYSVIKYHQRYLINDNRILSFIMIYKIYMILFSLSLISYLR